MKKQKLGIAEKKFRERQLQSNRTVEQSSAQLRRDLESAIDGLFLGISLGMLGNKKKK